MTVETFDPLRVVAALRAADVRHVLVGDLAAMAHGAPIEAERVEICLAGDEANVERLGFCLETLEAGPVVLTDDPHRVTFRTVAGELECVELPTDEAFERFESQAVEIDLGGGVHTRVAPPSGVVTEIRDAEDLVAVVRAASLETDEVPAFLHVDEDEFGPSEGLETRSPWRRVWKAFEDVDRFLTGVTEGKPEGKAGGAGRR